MCFRIILLYSALAEGGPVRQERGTQVKWQFINGQQRMDVVF